MSLRRETPCDFGPCPYEAEYHNQCEYWCGADEPEDYPPIDIHTDEEEAWLDAHSAWASPQNNPPIPEGIPAVWEENDEECDDCQCDGDCDNCDEYYWYT